MDRRTFLKQCFLTGLLIALPGKTFASRTENRDTIRPPGALTEDDFVAACVRCGECLKICPARCLKPVKPTKSFSGWETPEIITREAGCIRCGSCGRVCPTQAIVQVPQEQMKTGTSLVYRKLCLVWTKQKECLVCMEYCPVAAIYTDKEGRPIVNPAVCVGCGLCEQNCPVLEKTAAIRVSSAGEKRYHAKERKYY